jgi:hypothetical protein
VGGNLMVEAKPKVYKILGDRKNGTKFRHVEAESYIPFNKSYEELDDYQQKIYGKLYKVLTERPLAETEKPPYPLKGLQALYKPIIRKNKLVAKNGTVFFVALIDEEGKAEKVTVYQSPNRKFTEFLNILMFTTEFEPGTCDGVPCEMEFPFEMELRYVDRTKDIMGGKGVYTKTPGTE